MFFRNQGTGSFSRHLLGCSNIEPRWQLGGSDFPRKVQQDGSEGETHKEEVEKKYFPETQTADSSLKPIPFWRRVLSLDDV